MLVEEIKEDLAAAWRAGADYYRAAGEKLLEAKAQLGHGKFTKWVEENFDIGHRQATNYMALAEQNQNGIKIPLSEINNPRRAHRNLLPVPSERDLRAKTHRTNSPDRQSAPPSSPSPRS